MYSPGIKRKKFHRWRSKASYNNHLKYYVDMRKNVNLKKLRRKRNAGAPSLVPCCSCLKSSKHEIYIHEYFSGIYIFVFSIFQLLHLIMAAKINNEDISKAWLIITEVLSPTHANVRVIPSNTQWLRCFLLIIFKKCLIDYKQMQMLHVFYNKRVQYNHYRYIEFVT